MSQSMDRARYRPALVWRRELAERVGLAADNAKPRSVEWFKLKMNQLMREHAQGLLTDDQFSVTIRESCSSSMSRPVEPR